MGEENKISPERLAMLTIASYFEFKDDENCSPLEAASMVISNVAKAMMESNYNKHVVFNCLLKLAIEEQDSSFEKRIQSLIQETTRTLSVQEEEEMNKSIDSVFETIIRNNQKASERG